MIKKFADLRKNDVHIAGGKGSSLGEMINSGIPVPDGFVILSTTFEEFVEMNKLRDQIENLLGDVNHDDLSTIENASKQICTLILNSELPKETEMNILKGFKELNCEFVAVRSSATAEDSFAHTWAGQLESYLNTTEDLLLENVKRCFASLFTPRAIFYRYEKQLRETKISVAVVIQKMVQSEVSGIAFSVHPLTGNQHEILIEAGFGLGEAVVSGQIIPDSYIVNKDTSELIEKNIAHQEQGIFLNKGKNVWKKISQKNQKMQKLSDDHITELAKLVKKIESHYGFPCDIEWAYEKKGLYITQSRSITTLANVTPGAVEFVPKPADYIKFAQTKGVAPFFFGFEYLMHIKDLEGLVYYQSSKELFKTYFAKGKLPLTLKEGEKIYEDDVFILTLTAKLEETFKKATEANDALTKDPSLASFERYLVALGNFSHLYRYTDFMYTDATTISRSPEIEEIFEQAKLAGRKMLNAVVYDNNSFQKNVIKCIAEKHGISHDDLMWYSTEEVLEFFHGKRVDADELVGRKICYLSYCDKSEKAHIISGEKAQKMVDYFERDNAASSINGNVAYPGEVTGRAFVLEIGFGKLAEMVELSKKMLDGDILVADSTVPEIISLCNKASAILTNQGGTMSHAAIVARELKIPCIVGIGNATEKIKTGQQIRVDANLGFVTVL